MTREEAIEVIQKFMGWFKPDSRIYKALKMAIQALSQEPTKREIEREYLFQSLCEDFKKLQAENDDLRKRLEQEPCTDAISRVEALKIATTEYELKKIRELPSVNPQPCDDVVSRQSVLNAISKIGLCKCSTNEVQAVDECLRAVEALPPVTQKSGKWIITPFSVTGRHYQCSECKYIHTFTNFEYCPKCGVKMESEDKE